MDAPPVHYVKTSDGCNIAYAVMGEGRPLVCVSFPFSHLHTYWRASGDVRPWLEQAAQRFRLVYYDARGVGLSSRGLDPAVTIDAFVADLEAVVDRLELNRFVLYGFGFVFGHTAIHYAAKHPERVEGLVMMTSAVRGDAWPVAIFGELAKENWDAFLWTIAPKGASLEDTERNVERLRGSTSREDWLTTYHAFLAADVKSAVAALSVPTLVMHPREYATLHVEHGEELAASIRDSRLVLLDGSTRMGDVGQSLETIEQFIEALPRENEEASSVLSVRELEVLRLLAAGRSNPQIAEALVISPSTVAKHVSSILDKTGAANRVEAAVYARDHGIP